MSRIIVTEFLTLDGVMEDPGGAEGFDRGGWAFDQALGLQLVEARPVGDGVLILIYQRTDKER